MEKKAEFIFESCKFIDSTGLESFKSSRIKSFSESSHNSFHPYSPPCAEKPQDTTVTVLLAACRWGEKGVTDPKTQDKKNCNATLSRDVNKVIQGFTVAVCVSIHENIILPISVLKVCFEKLRIMSIYSILYLYDRIVFFYQKVNIKPILRLKTLSFSEQRTHEAKAIFKSRVVVKPFWLI